MPNENKHKHLDLISEAIARMSQNSFNVRSWCIAIVSAVVALAVEAANRKIALASLLPVFVFSIVDAYYLAIEREFRNLYEHVRKMPEENIDFAMTYSDLPKRSLLSALGASISWILYGGLTVSIVLISIAL